MTCLSCAQRAKLIAELRGALNGRDFSTAQRLMQDIFGTISVDISKLTTLTLKNDGVETRFNITDARTPPK